MQFEKFFSSVDALVSVNPIAGLAWGGIKFIIRAVSKHSKYFQRIISVLEKVGQNLHFYGRYATAIYKGNDRVMTELANVYGDILTVFMTIKKTFIDRRKRMRNFPAIVVLSLWFEGDFDAVVASLEERHIMLKNEVEHADREATHADREEHVIAKWREGMKHFLDLLHFEDFNCGEKHAQSFGKKMSSDSGTWLLEAPLYKNWRDSWGVESGSLFWLHGQPGSGKTVLTSLVIEDLKENKRANSRLLSFYCDYKFPEKSKAEYLFRSLLEQLLQSFDDPLSELPSPIHDVLAKFSRARSLTDIPLADVLIGLATCSTCEHLTIVIDALDECQGRESILSFLHQLPSSIHLFISSRDEDDIRRSFRSHSALREQKINSDDIEHDIRSYLVKTFDNHLEKNPNFVRDCTLREEIIETLVENANGMFLYVFFQVRSILEGCVTDADIRNALESLPDGIEETFIRILERIDKRPKPLRTHLRRILRLVVCFEHIGIDHLTRLLSIAEMGADWDPNKTINDPLKLISGCGHLISITLFEGKPSVTLTHLTVKQFLTSDPHSFDPDVTILPQYHCYPLGDLFMETARIFLKKHQMRGCPYLDTTWQWEDERQFVDRWSTIPDFQPPFPDILSTVFNAPLKENARPGPLVFPNATHVTALNCNFVDVEDELYISVASSQPAEFSRGPYVLEDVFPRLTHLRITKSQLYRATSAVHVLHDQRATTKPVGYPSQTSATHVTVEDIDFIHATNSIWIIRPGVETMPGVVLPEPQTPYFFNSFLNANIKVWLSGEVGWTDVSGSLQVSSANRDGTLPELLPPQELARDPDECSTGTSISEDSVDSSWLGVENSHPGFRVLIEGVVVM